MCHIVPEKRIKFGHIRLTSSREIPPEAGGSAISKVCFRYNFRPEVDNHVISDVAIACVGLDVRVKFGDSRSNGSRDIEGADFIVTNERT